jgi:hypothetical protein
MILIITSSVFVVFAAMLVIVAHAAALALTYLGRVVLGYSLFGVASVAHYVVLCKLDGLAGLIDIIKMLCS